LLAAQILAKDDGIRVRRKCARYKFFVKISWRFDFYFIGYCRLIIVIVLAIMRAQIVHQTTKNRHPYEWRFRRKRGYFFL